MSNTTNATRIVEIHVGTAGRNFGFIGSVRALNHRKIVELGPFGTLEAAESAAREYAAKEGWVVK